MVRFISALVVIGVSLITACASLNEPPATIYPDRNESRKLQT